MGFLSAEPILSLFGLKPDVVVEGAAYLRMQFVGSVAMSFWVITENIMYTSRDGITPMKVTLAARLAHVILIPFLVLGWWIFPRMGVSGAALANLVAYSVGMTLGLWFLFSGRTRLRLTPEKLSSGFKYDMAYCEDWYSCLCHGYTTVPR